MLGTRRLPGRPLILAGVAVAALVTGAGVAMAATSGSQTSPAAAVSPAGQAVAAPVPSGSPPAGWPGMRGPRPGIRGPGFAGGLPGAVHGQFVVQKPGGGYQTIDLQRGAVTAVSTTSITIKSSDGFTRTYQVTSATFVDARRDGISSVKSGHQAMVMATVNGSTVTAVRILDFSLLPAFHAGPGGSGWRSWAPPAAPATGGVG